MYTVMCTDEVVRLEYGKLARKLQKVVNSAKRIAKFITNEF